MRNDAVHYEEAISRTCVLNKLSDFQPEIAGTAPLGLTLTNSDIDILCFSPALGLLEQAIWESFRNEEDFSLRRWITGERSVVAVFRANGWSFQIYGSTTPVREQIGWALFQAELRLLEIGGDPFKARIMQNRLAGMKTIPAIAHILKLKGDPFHALLATADMTDDELLRQLQLSGNSE